MSVPDTAHLDSVPLNDDLLDRLLPMHLRLGAEGRIRRSGPTLRKMLAGHPADGLPLTEVMQIIRPWDCRDYAGLLAAEGQRLSLVLRGAPDLPLRGVLVRLPQGQGALIDLSLGLSFAQGVARFDLSGSDFSPCDQTIELLYLKEANTSTTRLLARLTERLSDAREKAERRALTDPLTGLANRRAMDMDLERRLADQSEDFAVLRLDLDRFKAVNDSLGHAAGDRVLTCVGDILRRDLRHGDLAARVGGDEFVVIVQGITDPAALEAVARRLIRRIERPVAFEGHLCRVSVSIGIAIAAGRSRARGADVLLADADAALYSAKAAGRGRAVLHGTPVAPSAPPGAPPADGAGGSAHAEPR